MCVQGGRRREQEMEEEKVSAAGKGGEWERARESELSVIVQVFCLYIHIGKCDAYTYTHIYTRRAQEVASV